MKPATFHRFSVLVVDGSEVVRQRLCELLAEEDGLHVVGEAGRAADAWEIFEQHRPEVVLLDLHLAEGSGLELLSRIKRAAPGCLVIVLTHLREALLRSESHRRGADYVLHKATEFEQVLTLLHRCARTPQPDTV
jgi:two-component system, NarL family, nitrate/nitrite response regulator NarL